MRRRPLAARVAMLGALYLAQGLPFGFQATALPVMLRRQGVGLEEVTVEWNRGIQLHHL